MIAVVSTAAILSMLFVIGHVQSEITGRTSPNLIDLGIAVAAALAGSAWAALHSLVVITA